MEKEAIIMATIVRIPHGSTTATTGLQHGTSAQIDADLEMLQRKIDACSRLIAECAAELSQLERRKQALLQAHSCLVEIRADPIREGQPPSDRELQVLRLVACGLRNAEIADMLMISEGTVKNHVSGVLTKLNARSRWDAALKARELGLI
jgi:DNA-binding NarL/FixJ family response regulator